MAQPQYIKTEQPVSNHSTIVYYDPIDRSEEFDPILKKCEETNGDALIIEENTIYEIDCDCYRQMQKRKLKKNNCVDPFHS